MAKSRGLYIFYVMSVWAKIFVRALACPKKPPHQISAQTVRMGPSLALPKMAILALQGGSQQKWPFSNGAQKGTFCGENAPKVLLSSYSANFGLERAFSAKAKSLHFWRALTPKSCDFWSQKWPKTGQNRQKGSSPLFRVQ